jgi:hypothetical protein
MTTKACALTAWVEIQGDVALHFVGREIEHAKYEVVGYSNQIALKDFRSVGLKAIDEVNNTRTVDKFALQFNAPAFVKIPDLGSLILSIELYNTEEADPANRLWIAVGATELPVYEYIHKRIVPFNDAFALFALYHRNRDYQSITFPRL